VRSRFFVPRGGAPAARLELTVAKALKEVNVLDAPHAQHLERRVRLEGRQDLLFDRTRDIRMIDDLLKLTLDDVAATAAMHAPS
jgi:hypothetical protein